MKILINTQYVEKRHAVSAVKICQTKILINIMYLMSQTIMCLLSSENLALKCNKLNWIITMISSNLIYNWN